MSGLSRSSGTHRAAMPSRAFYVTPLSHPVKVITSALTFLMSAASLRCVCDVKTNNLLRHSNIMFISAHCINDDKLVLAGHQ